MQAASAALSVQASRVASTTSVGSLKSAMFRSSMFMRKVEKVEKVEKVGKVGKVDNVDNVDKVGKVGKDGKIGKMCGRKLKKLVWRNCVMIMMDLYD
jgi:hypothetical protein